MVHEVVDVAHATLACDAETTDAPAYKVRVFVQGLGKLTDHTCISGLTLYPGAQLTKTRA